MSFKIVIAGFNEPVTVEMGRSILDSGIDQGLALPHSCRAGNCATCKCRLVSGEVELSPYSEFALTNAEREEGLILACRAVPWSDCEIEFLGEDDLIAHPMREMACRITEIEEATHDIRIIRLAIERGGPFTFSPGQYADLSFAGMAARSYSMAEQPGDDVLEFHIRHVPGGRASGHVITDARVGDPVQVRGPHGTSYLREGRSGPVLAIAGGSGLAPVKSIVDRALTLDAGRSVSLYFGVRDERDLYLEDYFSGLVQKHDNFRFVPVLSEPAGETERRTGYVTDAVKSDGIVLQDCSAYLAGPPPMVEAAEVFLKESGVGADHIHADAFYTQAELAGDGELVE